MKKTYLLLIALMLASAVHAETFEVRMNKDMDGDPLGYLLANNEGEPYEVAPFTFTNIWTGDTYYCDDTDRWTPNCLGLYGDLTITCTGGKITGLEAELFGWSDEDKPKVNVLEGESYNVSDAVGNISLNKDDDSIFKWTSDITEGYETVTIDVANYYLYFNKLVITWQPEGSSVPNPPAEFKYTLVQSDITDVFNPSGDEGSVTLTRNKQYNVNGFGFTFGGSAATAPSMLMKENSDGDLFGEINVYGGDTFTLTAGKDDTGKQVGLTYATFKLTDDAKRYMGKITVDKGQVDVNPASYTMTWWGEAATDVTFTIGEKAELGTQPTQTGRLSFKAIDVYTDKEIFEGGQSQTNFRYNFINNGTIAEKMFVVKVVGETDFSLILSTITPNLDVENAKTVIKCGDVSTETTADGQFLTATFPGPFTVGQEIPCEIHVTYTGGEVILPFKVQFPAKFMPYVINAPFTFTKAEYSVKAGETVATEMLNDKALPLTYTVADEAIATVDANGVVTAKAAGTTTVTAAFAGSDSYLAGTSTVKITVDKAEAPLSLTKSEYTAKVGETITLEVANEKSLPLTFAVADETVAGVDDKGVVTGLAGGTTTVTIEFAGNEVYNTARLEAKVTFEKLDAPLSLTETEYTVKAGETAAIKVENEKNLPLTFTAADETVASVDDKGVITGLAEGTTTVTIEFAGNEVYNTAKLEAKVTVTKTDGILTIGIDNADSDAIYFDLTGSRIANPAAGSIVIRVSGGKAEKLIVR